MPSLTSLAPLLFATTAAIACAAPDTAGDQANESFLGDKSDSPATGARVSELVLELVNTATFEVLDDDVPLNRRAVVGIVEHRDGLDATLGTADDDIFDSLQELDDVPFVGPVAFQRLVDYAVAHAPLRAALQVPLIDESDKHLLSDHNTELLAAGFATAPDSVTLSDTTDAGAYEDLLLELEKGLDAIGVSAFPLSVSQPAAYLGGPLDLCFTGLATDIPELMEDSLRDVVFSDELFVIAWKFGNDERITDAARDFSMDDPALFPPTWNNYDQTSDDFLVLTTQNDDVVAGALLSECQ